MDFSEMFDSMLATLGQYVPQAVAALIILLLGWILALVVRAGVSRLLAAVKLNERLKPAKAKQVDVERAVSRGIYYIVLLFVLIGVINVLNLTLVSDPLQALITPFFAFVPKLVAAGILTLGAWVGATLARTVVARVLGASRLDERFPTAEETKPISETLAHVTYWIVVLLFLPAILATLSLGGLLAPVEDMIASILAMVPNVLGAAIIGLVGWFVARILRDIVSGVLSTAGADRFGRKLGFGDKTNLSSLVGLIVQVFVFIPALIAALDALQIAVVSGPATGMLESLLAAVPDLVAAAAILAVAFILGRYVVNVLGSLLERLGFDRLPAKLGLGEAVSDEVRPSEVASKVVYFFIVLFALVEAARQIHFTSFASLIDSFIQFGAQVLLGVAVVVIGFWLANLAFDAIKKVSGDSDLLANLARYAILGLVLAMGLRAMGIADDIVNLTFGLTLGAVAVAFALAFGIGGREAAGKQLEHWFERLRAGRRQQIAKKTDPPK